MTETIENKTAYSVFKTKNYKQFKIIECNRAIDERHVQRLMNEIGRKNMLEDFPILVNEGYKVMDGQHRLEAAKRMNTEVFFIKSRNMDQASISTVNSTQKPWTLLDYVEWYGTLGKQDYIDAIAFTNKHCLDISTSISLLTNKRDGGSIHNAVRNGNFKISDALSAEENIKMANDFIPYFKQALTRSFIIALIRISKLEGYDHTTMMEKVEQRPRSLVRCPDIKGYMELLVEIYNYHNSKNKLYL